MKKTKLQVMVEYLSQLSQLKKIRKNESLNSFKKNGAKLSLFLLVALLISTTSQATTYYSKTSGGNWNTAASWSTVGYGNVTNAGTFPQVGDIANIGDGYTIFINTAISCATINVGQGVSGLLEFKSTSNYTLTVSGNITVNTGAKLWYNTAINRTHQINLAGNFTNYGIVDFYVVAGQIVNLTFNSTTNSQVIGTGTWDLNTVALNKTTSIATSLTISSASFESGIKTFIATYGTYIHNNASTYSINPTAATFTIGPNTIFKIPLGTMWFASAADNVILQGAMYVNGGTVKIGTTAGLQGIRFDQNGATIPYLEVTAGTLNVYGGITYGAASAAEPFNFYMSGGNISVNTGSTGSNRQLFYLNDVAGSTFTMTGGTITLQKPNTAGTAVIDFSVCGTNGTVAHRAR